MGRKTLWGFECNRLFTTCMSALGHNADPMKLSDLNQFLDKTVALRMTNGETAKVRVRLIDEEYDDLIVDILETSSPASYPDGLAAYTFAASDIVSAELAE